MTSYEECRQQLLGQHKFDRGKILLLVPSFAASPDAEKPVLYLRHPTSERRSAIEQLCATALRQLEQATAPLLLQWVLVAVWYERYVVGQPRHVLWGWTTTATLGAHPGRILRAECLNVAVPPCKPRAYPGTFDDLVHCRLPRSTGPKMELEALEARVRDRLGVYFHLMERPTDPIPAHLVHNVLTGSNDDLVASQILMHELPFERWRALETLLLAVRLQAVYRNQAYDFLCQIVEVQEGSKRGAHTVSVWEAGVLDLAGRHIVFPSKGRVALTPLVMLSVLTTYAQRSPLSRVAPATPENLRPLRAWVRRAWLVRQTPDALLFPARKLKPLKDMPPCVAHMCSMLQSPVRDKRDPAYLNYDARKYMVRALLSFGMGDEEVEARMRQRAQIVYAGDAPKLATRSRRGDMWIDTYLKRPGTLQLTCADVRRKPGWCPHGADCAREGMVDIEDLVAR